MNTILFNFSKFNQNNSFQMPVYSVKAHSEIINCIDGVGGLGIGLGAPEIVTGSRDGMYIVPFLMQSLATIVRRRKCQSFASPIIACILEGRG